MYRELEQKIFYDFKDKEILRLALSHKSHANEGRRRGVSKESFVLLHNERLEFLGDAVLGLVVSDLLSERYPNVDEGSLSKMRSALVNSETLAKIARVLNLGEYMLLGKGELASRGKEKDSILSSCYEAILGSIYLDGGLSGAFETIRHHFAELLDNVADISKLHDTKTMLQEICQANFRRSPAYKVVAEEGPDHEKIFEIMVSIGNYKCYGKGRNKKEAEQEAAKFLLEKLEITDANADKSNTNSKD